MSEALVNRLRQLRVELAGIQPVRANWSKIGQWHERARVVMNRAGIDHAERLGKMVRVQWVAENSTARQALQKDPVAHNAELARHRHALMMSLMDAVIEDASMGAPPQSSSSSASSGEAVAASPTKVFIVHGHDAGMKLDVARTLESLGLEAVILHEMPNGGRTIIEKFEEFSQVKFAVVLLSPDDMAYPAADTKRKANARARQNVVLELGFFLGKLGRDKVFILKRGDLEIPSDYNGVVYTPYDGEGWKLSLAQELLAANIKVDMNALVKKK